MDLSIIILNYNTKGLLKQCLKGIEASRLNLEYEIIVVDNASQDKSLEMVREEFFNKNRDRIRLIACPINFGYAAGNNVGLRLAQGKYLLILNPDVTVLSGSIEKMISFLEERPEVGMVGPKLLNPDGTIQYSCYRFPKFFDAFYRRTSLGKLPWARRELDQFLISDWDRRESSPVDWILGACLLLRREVLSKVGLLDERFFLYCEDIDWSRRFWQAGFKVYYLAETQMIHYHKRLSNENLGVQSLFNQAKWAHIVSWIKYFWKWRKKI